MLRAGEGIFLSRTWSLSEAFSQARIPTWWRPFLDDATFGALAPFFHEDCEILGPSAITGGQSEPRTGLEALRALWLDWLDPWESYRVEIDDVIDAGEHVVTLTRSYGRRAGMDLEVSILAGTVWTVRDGKIARVTFCARQSEALEAVGLLE